MIVAVTGHRPEKLYGGYTTKGRVFLARFARERILRLPVMAHKIITGMAVGWDQAVATAAVGLNLPFVAAVPCDGQERMWPDEAKERYRFLLDEAESIEVVCPGPYAGWKMQKRNEWMVDRCQVLMALYDGSAGGTDNCIKYATKKGKTIVNVWAEYEREAKRCTF